MIASEKCKLDLESVIGHDDPAIAAVTAMELLVGVEGWASAGQDEQALLMEGYFTAFLIEDYTLEVARMHALLSNHVRKIGRPRGAHDLIIAATAAVTGRTLLTTDQAAAFGELPGVRAEVVTVR
ncbi:MAG TPA: PIN domain-containing protein [Actinophytocola sp.]|uniref:PIN domain-containing protein n=1 Tax=Actinophytocola sp. TaxID=1872138 RepID=UPI002DDD5AF6|nr:PIN domain-containing protein [Actinophytocola sp.]HEV2783378.1 PIN domain-containing protein [Actinophytocola sp.]